MGLCSTRSSKLRLEISVFGGVFGAFFLSFSVVTVSSYLSEEIASLCASQKIQTERDPNEGTEAGLVPSSTASLQAGNQTVLQCLILLAGRHILLARDRHQTSLPAPHLRPTGTGPLCTSACQTFSNPRPSEERKKREKKKKDCEGLVVYLARIRMVASSSSFGRSSFSSSILFIRSLRISRVLKPSIQEVTPIMAALRNVFKKAAAQAGVSAPANALLKSASPVRVAMCSLSLSPFLEADPLLLYSKSCDQHQHSQQRGHRGPQPPNTAAYPSSHSAQVMV